MPISRNVEGLRWGLVIGATLVTVGLSLVGAVWAGPVEAGTVTITVPTPVSESPVVVVDEIANIALCAVAPPKEAWVAVQWQDVAGGWHTVDGWSGRLSSGAFVGPTGNACTVRWVDRSDFGKKYFRWVVYNSQGGAIWRTSALFALPDSANQWVWSEAATIAPAGTSAVTGTSASVGTCKGVHIVRAGENLFRIAVNCGLTTDQMAVANNIRYPYMIYIGQTLRYP